MKAIELSCGDAHMLISKVVLGTGPVSYTHLKGMPFYLGVQYHPEFKSRPNRPHPLFREFLRAAANKKTVQADDLPKF